jgi:hypothetical protein
VYHLLLALTLKLHANLDKFLFHYFYI